MTLSVIMHGAGDQDGEIDGPFFLCSTSAWDELTVWLRTLPDTEGELSHLAELAEEGEVTDTLALRLQLASTLDTYPPSVGVAATVARLLETVGEGDEGETLQVIQE